MVIIETERLIIRPYEEKDLPDYHRLMSDKDNMYFLDDLITNSVEESLQSLRETIKLNESGKTRRFCVTLKESGLLAGAAGYDILSITPVGKIADPMGWFMLPEYQGKGYAAEAVKKILEFAFLKDNCVRVATGCYKDNIPTQRVMAKAGFIKEAEKPESTWHDGRMKTRLEFAVNRNVYYKNNNIILG